MVTSRPSDRESAYVPLEYTFSLPRFPNTIAGESTGIFNIAQPTAAELTAYPALASDDVRIQHGTIPTGVLTVGQHIRLQSINENVYIAESDVFGYSAVYRVKKVINNQYTVIDTSYLGDVAPAGATITKYYNNFHLKIKVYINGGLTPVDTYRLYPTGEYTLSSFSLDVQDTIKRQLGPSVDPLQAADAAYLTSAWTTSGQSASHVDYTIQYHQVYDIPNSSGVNVLTETPASADGTTLKAINMIKPMVNYRNRSLDRNFTSSTDDIFLVQDPVVSGVGRFLTDAPTTQTIGRDQFASLQVMTDDEAVKMVIKTYPEKNAGGTIIGTSTTNVVAMDTTQICYVGTRHMGGSIITGATNSYTIELQKLSGTPVSELRTYNIDDNCDFSAVQFFWLNQLGGIDQFTFKGHQGEDVSVKKENFRRPLTQAFVTGSTVNSNTVTYNTEIEQDMYVGARVNQETNDWLRQLYMSNYIWMVDPDLDEFIPITITDQTTTHYDSKENFYTISVAYRFGFDLKSQI